MWKSMEYVIESADCVREWRSEKKTTQILHRFGFEMLVVVGILVFR